MSHYLIEQIAALAEHRGAHGHARRSAAEGEDGHLRALRDPRRRTASETARRRRLLRLHRRRAAHGLARRASSRATSAASSSPAPTRKATGWPLKRDPYLLETTRARRVRRRRRARALDQARGQRGRRGLDGRLAHPPVPRRRMTRHARDELRRVDLFDDLDDEQLGGVGRGRARCATLEPGDVLAEQGVDPPRACCSCSRATAQPLLVDERPRGADRPPATRRPGSARSPRSPAAPLGVRDAWPRRRAASALIAARATSAALAFAQPVGAPARDARRSAPVMSRHHGDASRTASGSPRSARWPPASRTSSTTRRRPRGAPPRELADALDVDQPRRSRAFVEAGVERDGRRAAASRSSDEALARRRRAAPRSTRSTPPTPRTRCSTRLEDARRRRARGGSPSRSRAAGVDADVARRASHALAGPATDAGAALGRRLADRAQRSPPSCSESTERMSAPRRRGQGLRLHGPRRAASRSTSTRGSRRRSTMLGHKLKHTQIEVVRDYDRDAAAS